jgi:Zn-dependent protease with chaperone function
VAKLLIPLGVLIYAVIRALWVTVSPPTGLVLTAADAPLLFDFLGALRRKTRGPHIHHVLVTEDMNAAIMQIPRLGLFGWQTNYLLLGLPILQALSPDQMKAVIAHEFGHLAGAHGKFSAWIYRIRKTWAQLAQQIAMRSQWSAFLFRGFFAWYAPFFSAYSFVFARANEYEADRFAAEAVGADVAGAALISVEMKAQHLSSVFWPEFERQVEMVPEPPTPPHAAMAQFFGGSASRGEASDLKALLARQTGLADTHPSLADRLKALGCAPIPCEPVETTAAAHFLDASLSRIVQQIDATWRSWAMPRWQERYADAAAARNQLQALRTKAGTEPLNGEECRDFATLTERFDGDDAALPLYRGVLAKRPADALISYLLGRLLLRRSDDEGIALIDAAMDADSDAILSGCDLIYGYLRPRERYSDAERYRDRWIDRRDLLDRDEAERSTFAERDTVLPHELNSDAVADIVSQLGKWRVIRRAYVVRKELSAMPERPLLILVIETVRWPGSRKVPPDITNVLAQEVRMPGETLFARIGARHRGLRRKLRDVPDALIYQR